MRDEIQSRYEDNIGRVKRVVDVYEAHGEGSGRRPVHIADLLRAAVVLLHATLEDVLRSLAEWKLPTASPSALADLPLVGMKGKTRWDMKDLAVHRGRSIDAVITASVREYLERSNYNNLGEIKSLFEKIGIGPTTVDPFSSELASMMQRRHWIVHRADKNMASGRGHHPARSISRSLARDWIDAVERFVAAVLAQV